MAHLDLEQGLPPGTKKGVISLFFRVPQASLDKCTDRWDAFWDPILAGGPWPEDDPPIVPPLLGFVPLMTFGAPYGRIWHHPHHYNRNDILGYTKGRSAFWIYTGEGGTCSIMMAPPDPEHPDVNDENLTQVWLTLGDKQIPQGPSFLGVSRDGFLTFRVQYPDLPRCAWYSFTINSAPDRERWSQPVPYSAVSPCGPPTRTVDGQTIALIPGYEVFHNTFTYVDSTNVELENHGKEFLGIPHVENRDIPVKPDEWHHVLISFDFSGVTTASSGALSSTCYLNIALDDVLIKWGKPFPGSMGEIPAVPDNGIFSDVAGEVSRKPWFNDVYIPDPNPVPSINGFSYQEDFYTGGGDSTYEYAPPAIPAGPIGIPATADCQDAIEVVEMAVLQIFADKTLDLNEIENRRAFLDKNGKPARPSLAKDLLGEPTIVFHKRRNWIQPDAKGTAVDAEGEAPFAKTGTIEPYNPDPDLPLEGEDAPP